MVKYSHEYLGQHDNDILEDLTDHNLTFRYFDAKVLKESLYLSAYDEWNSRWHEIDEAHQTKVWAPDVMRNPDLIKLCRSQLGLCIQFITGHNWLLRHKRYYLENPQMDQTCRLCNAENSREDAIHFWTECTALRAQRNKIKALYRRSIKKSKSPQGGYQITETEPCFNLPIFSWSPTLLVQFLANASMNQLLCDPEESN